MEDIDEPFWLEVKLEKLFTCPAASLKVDQGQPSVFWDKTS